MNYLTAPNIGIVEIAIVDEAKTRRDELLAEAATITTVTDQIDADAAAETLRRIKEMTRAVESSRAEVKRPVLDLTRQIDAMAKELSAQLDAEAGRISRVLGAWQAEERRKAEEARRRAAEEERRIREEAARKAAEAEMEAASTVDAAKAVAQIEDQAVEQIAQTRQAAEQQIALARPAGTKVREIWCFEVVDIKALYAAAPHLVNLEPNGNAIRAVIKTNHDIPGLRIWKEARSII